MIVNYESFIEDVKVEKSKHLWALN